MIDNISYLVGDDEHPARLMHPGDALFVPGEPVEVLAAPGGRAVDEDLRGGRLPARGRPEHAVPIHQGIVAPEARGIYYGRLTEMTDTDFRVLPEENSTRF